MKSALVRSGYKVGEGSYFPGDDDGHNGQNKKRELFQIGHKVPFWSSVGVELWRSN